MLKIDWAVLGLNATAALVAIIALVSLDQLPVDLGLLLAVVATVVNSALLIHRAVRRPEALPLPVRDDLDAHQILDIDARLDAFERAEARRFQTLVDEGVVRSPASETDVETVRASRPLPNGRG